MKWFKHQSDARNSLKLRKVRRKYGADGYAIYWFCLEAIAYEVDKDNLTFDLKEDAETIAFELSIQEKKVEEIMHYMVETGLFESSQGVITCLKLAESIDKSMTNSPLMRKWLGDKSVMTSPDTVKTCAELEVDKKKKRKEVDNNKDIAFDFFWSNMKLKKAAKPKALLAFNKHATKETDPMVFAQMLVDDTKDRARLNQFGFDRLNPTTYLNGCRWEDDKPVNNSEKFKYVLDSFNDAMSGAKVPFAESMTESRVNLINHLFATTSLKPDTVHKLFNHIAISDAFKWERGETTGEAKDLSYFLTEQAYNKAREQ